MHLRYNRGTMTKKSGGEITLIEEVQVSSDRIDRVIWRGMGVKSVREMAEETGLKPEEVLRRKNEMLDEVDILSIQEKRQRLVIELDGIARDARERAAKVADEYASGMLNTAVAAMKTYLSELARMEKADDGKIQQLNQMRIRELLRLIDETVTRSVREIASTREIPENELMEIFQGHLTDAARELDLMS